jgi:hypothetical protein
VAGGRVVVWPTESFSMYALASPLKRARAERPSWQPWQDAFAACEALAAESAWPVWDHCSVKGSCSPLWQPPQLAVVSFPPVLVLP